MKTFALVDISGLRHMTDDRDLARDLRAEAEARGTRLILMRPMESVDDDERLTAITTAIKQSAAGASTADKWSMIMAALDDLKAAVAKGTTVMESAITLINDFASKASVSSDPAMVALATDLNSESDKLAAKILENTAAAAVEPTPVAPPADLPA